MVRGMLLIFCCLLYISICRSSEEIQFPLHLNAENFEHVTQAATGQTTGIWFVIFSSKLDEGHQLLLQSWRSLAHASAEEMPNTIFAKVYSEESPSLLHRLKISELPAVYLFRDQKMYIYEGPLEGGDFETIPNLRTFLKDGFQTTLGLSVPKDPSYLDTLKEQVKLEIEKMTRTDKIMLGIGLSCLAVSLIVLACKWWADMRSPPEQLHSFTRPSGVPARASAPAQAVEEKKKKKNKKDS